MTVDLEFMKATLFAALGGLPTTLKLTFLSLLFASPLAFGMAFTRIYQVKGLCRVVAFYVSFVRGTPMVLQILLIYSLLPSVLNQIFVGLGLNIKVFELNPILYAYTVFTLNSAAILSEVFRSALLTVPKGQLEAAYCAGLSPIQAYGRIVLPQAMHAALPNLCNAAVNLLKGTSLAFLMTVKDITAIAKIEAAYGYNYVEAYLVIFVIYIVMCSMVQAVFHLVEKRAGQYKTGKRKKGGKGYAYSQ